MCAQEELTDSRTSELALLQNRLNIAQAGLEAEKVRGLSLNHTVCLQ